MRHLPGVCLAVLLAQSALSGQLAAESYTLGAGDQVRLKVYEWRSAVGDVHEWKPMNAEFSVTADGNLSLPIVGTVPAAGHTLSQLSDEVAAELQKKVGLASAPQVSVEILTYRPFYILGSVSKPGEYPFRPGLTVLQAVSIAGGLYRPGGPSAVLDSMSRAGDLQVFQLDLNVLLARRARLKAELDGSGKLEFPRELLQQAGNSAIAQVMEQEKVMFAAKREALRSETAALNGLKDLLNGEVGSLQAKIKNLDQQIALLKSELASTTNLVERGLAVAPREFQLRQTQLQTEGQRLDLDTAMLRAREDIGKADQALVELNNKTRSAALTELAQVESKFSETASRVKTLQSIVDQEGGLPDPIAGFAGTSAPRFSILRRSGEGTETLAATQTTIVQPGDTIEVRQEIKGALPSPAESARPSADSGAASAASEAKLVAPLPGSGSASTAPEAKLVAPPQRKLIGQGPQPTPLR